MFFRNEYDFLSNFAWINLPIHGQNWATAEHMFAACKTTIAKEREAIRLCKTPAQAKRMGKKVTLRPDWDTYKNQAMLAILRLKFKYHQGMQQKLLATGNLELVENNYWHDNYWGSCICPKCGNQGKNMLGKFLMQVRSELQEY